MKKRNLRRPLEEFLAVARAGFQTVSDEYALEPGWRLIVRREDRLREIADELEETREFRALAQAVQANFYRKKRDHVSPEIEYRSWLSNLFRTTSVYLSLACGEEVSLDELEVRLRNSFGSPAELVEGYLLPIEFYAFEQAEIVFPGFEIRSYEPEELEFLVNPPPVRVFYPDLVVDLSRLQNFFYLMVPVRRANPGPPKHLSASPGMVLPLRKNFYPEAVIECLIPLLIYRWHKGQPFFPCVITIGGRLIDGPAKVQWFKEVAFNWPLEDGTKDGPTWMMKQEQVDHLVEFVRLIQEDLRLIKSASANWNFIQRGLEYFIRGSYGLDTEAFLWNMAALEAFLQQKDMPGGITAGLTRRLVRILEGWQPKKVLRDRFRDLYNLRSRVVHGDVDEVSLKDLTQLQQMVQLIALWLVRLFANLERAISQSGADHPTPTRSDVLQLLDLNDVSATRFVLETVPADFPYYQSVIEGE